MKDGHVKDAAEDVAEDVTLDAAGDVFGAAKDGSVKVLILTRVILQWRNPRPTHACRPPRPHVKDAAQGVAEDVSQDATQDLAFRARATGGAHPPRHATTAAVFVHLTPTLRYGRNWAAQWHYWPGLWGGKRFRGCRAKRLYVHLWSSLRGSRLQLPWQLQFRECHVVPWFTVPQSAARGRRGLSAARARAQHSSQCRDLSRLPLPCRCVMDLGLCLRASPRSVLMQLPGTRGVSNTAHMMTMQPGRCAFRSSGLPAGTGGRKSGVHGQAPWQDNGQEVLCGFADR